MGDVERFEKICLAMMDHAFYPHPVQALERRDTHISAVFLTGDWVYKLKKPFDFGFLDYTSLENRRLMCEREVSLNQRLSSGVYDGVIAVRRSGESIHLGSVGEAVEYAVKMRQLPDRAALSSLLVRGCAGHDDMVRLGRMLGAFYSRSPRNPEIDRYGNAEVISFNTEENFRQLSPFVGTLISGSPLEFVKEAGRGFFRDCTRRFDRRVEEERIRDGHGDLRAEHVYLIDRIECPEPDFDRAKEERAIQIIDCIEFNERFRYGDAASDLAFLHMDMERTGHSDLSLSVLSGYIEESGDCGVYTVLDFYSCYRAVVKLKVSCLTWNELQDGARRDEMKTRVGLYLALALRYAVQFSRPTIWVFCGLPGTGKSTLAERVRDVFGIMLLRSDQVRTELPEYASRTGPVPLGTGIYRQGPRGRVYAHLLALAQGELKKGMSVILDATFSQRHWREEAVRLAEDMDANILFFECVSSEATMLARLGRREAGERNEDGRPAARESLSDARVEHLPGLLARFEPLNELPSQLRSIIDTDKNLPDECLRKVLPQAYVMRRSQVEKVMERL
ncbi:MAG: AAA family ATPase [Syntrophobacter sp.]